MQDHAAGDERATTKDLASEGTAPSRDPDALPDLDTRIREAQRQAREQRVRQGLPAEADEGEYTPRKARKHAPKRGKNHGQFLGTVADSWEATRRR